ncbi:hypothetical protein AMTRI_Chr01g133190 [Amborella trichopoda]
MASAFFASQERRSYINLNTIDMEEDEEEAKDRAHMLTKPVVHEVPEKASNGVDASPV